MNRLLLVCVCGGFCSAAATAADPYENWLMAQQQRGVEIELIRVASEKPLLDIEETDPEVADILDEVEAIEEAASDQDDTDESS